MRKRVAGTAIATGLVVVGTAAAVSAAVLSGGTHAKAGTPGGTVLWTAPATPAATTAPTTVTAPRSGAATPPSATSTARARATAAMPPITYVVKSGDNLYVIAAWFKLHGYGALYEQNRAAIGSNPALIYPGLRITVSGRGLTTSR